jgi:hypothetical protein
MTSETVKSKEAVGMRTLPAVRWLLLCHDDADSWRLTAGLHIVTCQNLAIFINHGIYTIFFFSCRLIYVTMRSNIVMQYNFMTLPYALFHLFYMVEDC